MAATPFQDQKPDDQVVACIEFIHAYQIEKGWIRDQYTDIPYIYDLAWADGDLRSMIQAEFLTLNLIINEPSGGTFQLQRVI